MKLYEIAERYNNLAALLEDDTIPAEVVAEALKGVETELNEKVEQLAYIIKNTAAEVDALRGEEQRLAKRRRAAEAKIESIKAYCREQMMSVGVERIKGAYLTVGVQNTPAALIIDNEADLPMELFKPQPAKLDSAELKNRLLKGETIAGAHLEQGKALHIR